jgi:hypothetical protein
MRFTGFECDPQRPVRAEQMLLTDYFVDIAGPQAFGERNIGTGFFEHDVLGIISAFPDAVRAMVRVMIGLKAACCRTKAQNPHARGVGNVLHYDSDRARTNGAHPEHAR